MQGKLEGSNSKKVSYEWHKWFAWYPVKMDVGLNKGRWVWLKVIWRNGDSPVGCGGWYWYYAKNEEDKNYIEVDDRYCIYCGRYKGNCWEWCISSIEEDIEGGGL